MLPLILRVAGSLVLLLWGIAYIMPVRSILRGFGTLASEQRRIVVSTCVAEGLAFMFVGAMMGLITYYGTIGGRLEGILGNALAGFLLASALLGAFTKARTRPLAMKLCPWIETAVAALFILSGVL